MANRDKPVALLTLDIRLPDWLAQAVAACPACADDETRMAFVIELARHNVDRGSGGPFGAAVFESASGRLIAAATNLVVESGLSVAHAEVVALSLAQRALGSYDLGASDLPTCELVTSVEPCMMCTGALLWSGVRRLVFGASGDDARAIGFDEGPKPWNWIEELRERGINVVGDVRRAEAVAVLAQYRASGGPIYNARSGR